MHRRRAQLRLLLTRLFGVFAALAAAVCAATLGCRNADNEPAAAPASPPQAGEVMFTICYDNYSGPAPLQAAWGFSCLVRGLEKTILFDTGGDGRTLLANMKALEIDPAGIDVIVLSHVHGDHTGGLWDVLRACGGAPVYAPTGFPGSFAKRVEKLGGRFIEADEPTDICPGAATTGTQGKGRIEEHGLRLRTPEGWVLLTGCAHPGVDAMAEQATRQVAGGLRLVMGGFHMGGAPRRRIEGVIEAFEALGVAAAAPCHCSGDATRELFEQRYGDRYIAVHVGTSLRFGGKDAGGAP